MIINTINSTNEIPGKITKVCFISGCQGICDYCYNRDLWNKSHETIDIQQIISAIKKDNEKYKLIDAISITGAEPLLSSDNLSDLLDTVRQNLPEIFINVDTSLTQGDLNLDIINFTDRFGISVKEVWGNDLYKNQVQNNLDKIIYHEKKVELRFVLTKRNYQTLIDVVDLFRDKLKRLLIERILISMAIVTNSNKDKFLPLSVIEFDEIFNSYQSKLREIFPSVPKIERGL